MGTDDSPSDGRVVRISFMRPLERLESQYFAAGFHCNEAVQPMRVLDIMREDESRIASCAPFSGDDEFLQKVAQCLGVGRAGFADFH